METAEQTGQAPSKPMARESLALRRLMEAGIRGCDETSEQIVQSLHHRRQSLAESPSARLHSVRLHSAQYAKHVDLTARKTPTKRTKDMAC
jgi:hypothetical protein